jgi:protease-4
VDGLGGFWAAADTAAGLGKIPQDHIVIRIYPRQRGLLESVSTMLGQSEASLKTLQGLGTLAALPGIKNLIGALVQTPHGGVELKAPDIAR